MNSHQKAAISSTSSGCSIIIMHSPSKPHHSRICQNGPLNQTVIGQSRSAAIGSPGEVGRKTPRRVQIVAELHPLPVVAVLNGIAAQDRVTKSFASCDSSRRTGRKSRDVPFQSCTM